MDKSKNRSRNTFHSPSLGRIGGRVRFLFFLFLFLLSFPLSAQEFGRITLLFAGDLMQHQGQIDAARRPDGTFDYSPCFVHVREEVSRADLAIANLEVTLAGPPYRGYPQFSAPDAYAAAIKEAGFDILLTANNHCLDRHRKGLERTIHVLDSMQISYVGTYATPEERSRRYPLLVEQNGFRLVFLNYTYGTNGLLPQAPNVVNYIDKARMAEDIRQARAMKPDLIFACMHWGIEYRSNPEQQEHELARWLISQGVDHVIGGHPHVIQPMELVPDTETAQRHVVVYSLGNYISNMSAPNTDGGAMLKLVFQKVGHISRLTECRYSLVWTSRPVLSGQSRYSLYPAANPPADISEAEASHLDRFVSQSRNMLTTKNIGIDEYFFE